MSSTAEIITIDGPSGVGKGAVSLLLAQDFNYSLLDSGAIYRLAAFYIMKHNIDINNEKILFDKLHNLNIHFTLKKKKMRAFIEGTDFTDHIRKEHVGIMASRLASIKIVRTALLKCQKSFSLNATKGLVADGRDMGTVVFPNARYKFFLEADDRIRAKRRHDQICSISEGRELKKTSFLEVLEKIRIRDSQDRNRLVSPLKPAEDAIIINTNHLSIHEVFTKVCSAVHIKNKTLSISRVISAYYQLIRKSIDELGCLPELLNHPTSRLISKDARLLCQTRNIFFLSVYFMQTKTKEAKDYAYKLYQLTKIHYFDTKKKTWIKSQNLSCESTLYEYSFLLLALSVLYKISKDNSLIRDIENVKLLITKNPMLNNRLELLGAAQEKNSPIRQNALMHLFEAYLSVYRYTQDTYSKVKSEILFKRIISLFFDKNKKLMKEYCNLEGSPAVFEPGHNFEWSCLILEAKNLNVDVGIMSDHYGLYQSIADVGITSNGHIKPNLDKLNEKNVRYRIWPILEQMRYLAMTKKYEVLDKPMDLLLSTFLSKIESPLEYVDADGLPCFNGIKTTTGYHLINLWQYLPT